MTRHLTRDLGLRLFRAVACVAALASAPQRARAQISVGPSTHVSSARPTAAHTEYFADGDPGNPSRLAVCSMVVDPTHSRLTTAVYLSTDRGAQWRLALEDSTSRYGTSWDPACAFAPGNIIHFASLPNQSDPRLTGPRDATRFARSLDGGKTWEPPVIAPFLDNEDIAVDWTSGPTRGRVYVVGVRLNDSVPGRRQIAMLYSTDSGRTYKGPVERAPALGTDQGSVSAPIVLNDGRGLVPVVISRARARPIAAPPGGAPQPASPPTAAADSIPPNVVAVIPILDGGARFGEPVTVAPFGSCSGFGGSPPMAAVDRSAGPFRNRVYVVYVDGTYGRCQVMLSRSDNGTTWSTPLAIDDPRVPTDSGRGPDTFLPQVVVSNRGVVGITWYDRREDPRNHAFRQRFTASLDGGESVVRSVAASEFTHAYAVAGARENYFGLAGRSRAGKAGSLWVGMATGSAYRTYEMVGDYGGMAVDADGVFHPVWVDNRSGVPQLYTAPVTVSAPVKRPAERNAALGANVSDSVVVLPTSTVFDQKTCSIRFAFDLLNSTHRPLRLPLVVRPGQMLSQFGVPRAEGPVDDLGRSLWSVGTGGRLAPDSVVSHTTTIRLDDCTPLGGPGFRIVRIDARVEASPLARLAGPKVLLFEASVFEPGARMPAGRP